MGEDSLKDPSECRRIEAVVLEILKSSDLETDTELSVRAAAAERLGFQLSGEAHRRIVGQLIDSFLISNADSILGAANNDVGDKNEVRMGRCGDGFPGNPAGKVICKLSEKRWVTVHDPYGIRVLSIRDFHEKDGIMLPSKDCGINLSKAKWSSLKKSFSSIDEAISKMELQLRENRAASALDNPCLRFEAMQKKTDTVFSAENNQAEIGACEILDTVLSPSKRMRTDNEAEITTAVAESAAGNSRRIASISNLTTVTRAPIKRKLTEPNASSLSVNASNCQVDAHTDIKQETTVASGKVLDSDDRKRLEDDTSSLLLAFPNQGQVPTAVNVVRFEESEPLIPAEIKQNEGGVSSTMPKFPAKQNPHPARLVPIQPARFDGRNYHPWRHQIEIFLNQLNIAYVLTEPCPGIPGNQEASSDEKIRIRAAAQRWIGDDYLCRHHVLSSLSDGLFQLYSQKAQSARELWEELNSAYNEDFGTIISQVNKYLQFQMFDGVSILEQVQKLDKIANSIMASGIWMDENFHASAIISKLPSSWKDFRARLMQESSVALKTLMHRLWIEEDSRNGYSKENSYQNDHTVDPKLDSRSGMRRKEIKRVCFRCGKEGHIVKYCPDRSGEKSNKEE